MRRLVFVLADGLRPDAVSPGVMPSLNALGDAFTRALHARTVRPSATVAALASLATGVGPETHRLIEPGLSFLPRLRTLRPVARELATNGIPVDIVTADLGRTAQPIAWDDVTFIVTADHGGGGVRSRDHDEAHLLNDAIPLVLAGRGVTRHHQLSRPISLLDLPATILWWFGVDVPACYEGRPITEAFQRRAVAVAV